MNNNIDKWSIVEIINKPFDDGLDKLRNLFETLTKRNENIYEQMLAYKTNNPSIYYNILEGLINYLIIKQIIIVYRYYNCYVINLDSIDKEDDIEKVKDIVKDYYFDFVSKGELNYSLDIYIEKHLKAVRGEKFLVINELNEESLDYINYAPYNYNNIVKFNELVKKALKDGKIKDVTQKGILEKLFVVDDEVFKLLIKNNVKIINTEIYITKIIYNKEVSSLLPLLLDNLSFNSENVIKSKHFVGFIEALIKYDKDNKFIKNIIESDNLYEFYKQLKRKYLFDEFINSITDKNNKDKLLKFDETDTNYNNLRFYINYGEWYFNKFIKGIAIEKFVKEFNDDNNKNDIIEKLATFNLSYLRYILGDKLLINNFIKILEDYKNNINE